MCSLIGLLFAMHNAMCVVVLYWCQSMCSTYEFVCCQLRHVKEIVINMDVIIVDVWPVQGVNIHEPVTELP